MRWGLLGFVLGWLLHGWWQRAASTGVAASDNDTGEPTTVVAPAAAFARGPVESTGDTAVTNVDLPAPES